MKKYYKSKRRVAVVIVVIMLLLKVLGLFFDENKVLVQAADISLVISTVVVFMYALNNNYKD